MKKLLDFLYPLFRLNYTHPYTVLGIALILTFIGGYYASKLKVDTDLANLLPDHYPSVQAIERLKETVGGETSMEVAIKSPDFDANVAVADSIIARSLKLYDNRTQDYFFKRAEFRKEVTVLENNALFLATDAELEEVTQFLVDEIEQIKLEANPFYFDFDDEEEEETEEDKNFDESYAALVPSEYPVNEDSTVLVVKLFPTGSKSDTRFLKDMFATFDTMLSDMEVSSFHPEMEVQFGGRLKRHVMELDAIMDDVFKSFASGISAVLLLVMLYFFIKKYKNYKKGDINQQTHAFWEHIIRIPIPLMVIGVPLLVSLILTFGLTYGLFGFLNTMTSVLFVILFGMGIDYGIHFYARYLELRSDGNDVIEALNKTYESTGVAIATSALTTAAAMYVLTYADFRGFSEFGFISGTGIVLALIAMLFLLPAILILFERWNWILITTNVLSRDKIQPKLHRFPFAKTIVVGGILISAITLWNVDKLSFEYNFGKLEPVYPEYEAYLEFKGEGFSSNLRNPAYVLADSREQVVSIADKLEQIVETDTLTPTIYKVEALPERFPIDETEIAQKLDKIANIRKLLDDPFLINSDEEAILKLRKAASTVEPLPLDSLPEFITQRFVTKQGEIGNFVIVYPSKSLSDGKQSIAFKNDVGTITTENNETFYAASTSIVAAAMLDLMIQESPYMVGATFVIIIIIMSIAFRSLRWMIIALLPLIVGLIWTFTILWIFDIPFNFYNLVVLPAILGIGEDNGVHLASRYIEEGRSSMWKVLSSTGQHVSIGSITTMLGFMGLLSTSHPGLYSIGLLATIGIGLTLVSALTFLPALIQVLEDLDWIHFDKK